jgi:3-oxoacyl-[acyl-carrier protein] reductase
MNKLLNNKTAIVTGANRGIGESIIKLFAENGANIIACTRKESKDLELLSDKLKKEYDISIDIIYMDLSDEKSVNKAIKDIFILSRKIDILVNNAGVAVGSLFQMTPISKLKELFEVNFFNQLLFSQGIAKMMVKNNSGSIIFLSSIASTIPDPGTLAYGTSKSALSRASKSMAIELGKYNIRVNVISPGIVRTDMYDQMSVESRDKLINSSIMKRAAKAEEVAKVALFLSSNLSDFITGQDINVDGGVL